MTAALGVYGGYKPESGEVRALGSFAADKFAYQDQQKNIIQLNNAVGYISGYMRKMQKGIDDASQNFIQQIQGLISEIFVLFAGGGDTGLDFGDLKYIFQALGALFGFGDGVLPINLFAAAWHFFSTYIIPVNNFHDLMDLIIDGAIASILDLFGEIPIFGQALQQLAVIISSIRDALGPLTIALDKIFGVFSGDWLSGDFGTFDPLWDAVTDFFGVIAGPVLAALVPIFQVMADWSIPFIDALTKVVEVVTNLIELVIGDGDYASFFDGSFNILAIIPNMIANFIQNGLLGPNSFLNAFNIFGLLGANNIPLLSITQLFNPSGGVGPNLLVEPGFDSIDSISVGNGWIRDATVGRTSVGAAKVTLAGVLRELESVSIPVAEGDTANVGAWLKWSALGYTGTNPVTLNVNRYLGTTYVGTTQVVTQTSPATNQASFIEFTGSYTVPAGCDNVRLTFRGNATATSGFAWFDDASFNKTSSGMPQSWIFNLIPDLGALGDFIKMVVDAIFDALGMVPIFGGVIAGFLTPFRDLISGWFDDTEDTAAVATDAVMGVQATQNVIQTGTTGVVTTTATDTTVQDAVTAQSNQIASQAAALLSLTTAQVGNSYSGGSWGDDFEYVNATTLDPTLWSAGIYTEGSASEGYMAVVDGHNAGMVKVTAGDTPCSQHFVYKGPGHTSLTDYQNNEVVVAEGMMDLQYFGDSRICSVDVYDRVSADGLTWVRARFWCNKYVEVQYKNGGAITNLLSPTYTGLSFNAIGSRLGFQAGVGLVDRNFRCTFNGKAIPASGVSDGSAVTAMGTLYRESAIGQRLNGLTPGKLIQFAGNDNRPADTLGSGCKIYRAANTLLPQPTGTNILAANMFDSIETKTPDITVNLATGGIKINTTGWYLFYLRLRFNNDAVTPAGTAYGTSLYKTPAGGSNAIIGRMTYRGSSDTLLSQGVDTFPVYVTAGDEFFFGTITAGLSSFPLGTGDAGGTQFFAGCALINRTPS